MARLNPRIEFFSCDPSGIDVPDGQNTTGLGETSLLLNTTDALLQNGGNLGGLGLGLGGVGTDLLGGAGDGAGDSRADLGMKNLSATRPSGLRSTRLSSMGRARVENGSEDQSSSNSRWKRSGC